MNTSMPPIVPLLLLLSMALLVFSFYRASGNNIKLIGLISVITIVQGMLAYSGFYTNFDVSPPRIPLLVLPSFLIILIVYFTPSGKRFLDQIDQAWLTFSHIIRFPVELVLYWLFLKGMVPELMTFEGRNYDIISGLSAPFLAYWAYVKKQVGPKWLLLWNFICLGLLLNIVLHAILSAPTPFQQLSFDVPNTGVFYFPYALLPSIIVPLVFLSHLICIRQLIQELKRVA